MQLLLTTLQTLCLRPELESVMLIDALATF